MNNIIFIFIIGFIIYNLYSCQNNEYFQTKKTTKTVMPKTTTKTTEIVMPKTTTKTITSKTTETKIVSPKTPAPAPTPKPKPLTSIPIPQTINDNLLLTGENTIEKKTKKLIPENDVRISIGTTIIQTEFSKMYPIGTNFDAWYDNYNNLISNSSISLLNEIINNVKFKANQNSKIINFNPGLKQTKSLYILEEEIKPYGVYIVSLMNSVATMGNSFSLIKITPITKEQYENQLKVNFTIEVKYKYPKKAVPHLELTPSDFNLVLNVIILFEKTVFNSVPSPYLHTISLLGLSSFNFLSGYSK